jgi:long-subunit acyl-CoA synthetase (AMP-forming)
MIMAMLGSLSLVQQYDLSHVNTTIVGASVLPSHVAAQFSEMLSGCHLLQGYGLTETTVAVTLGNPGDSMFGSCGHLLPGCKARLIDDHGKDVDAFEVPGRLLIQAPTVMIGYLNNEKADREVFLEGGWLDTGDLVMFRLSPAGHGHLFLVDRIKELIKVRVSLLSVFLRYGTKSHLVAGHASLTYRG